ncbi:MAG: methyl-accepting chemotaxis protein [Anaerolineales bacterium]
MNQAEMNTPTQENSNQTAGLWGWFSSIERRLFAFLLVVGIVPLLVMAWLSYIQAQDVLRASVESELDSVASLTEDRVERWLNAREADAQTYSSMQFATGDSQNELDLGIEVIITADGTVEGTRAQRSARNVMEDILEATDTTYRAIYLTDINGRVLVGAERRAEAAADGTEEIIIETGFNEGHSFGDALFFEAVQGNDAVSFFRSDVIYYEPFDVTTMFITHEVIDSGNMTPIGYIVLQVSQSELRSLMENFAAGDGRAYLQSGNFLVGNQEIIPLPDGEAIRAPEAQPGVDDFEGFNGETVLGSWRGNTQLDFVVYAQVPRGEALSAVNSLAVILLAVSLISIAVIALVAFFIGRWLTRPITGLTDAARDIASGSLDTRVDTDSGDELGVLAQAFNDMTQNLRVRVTEEKQNREYLEQVLTSYMQFVERVSRGDLTARLSLNGQEGPNLIVANVNVEQDDNLLRLGYNLNRMVEALHSMASQTRDVAASLSEAAAQILESSTSQIAGATQQDASVSQTTSTVAEIRATVAETAERAQMVAEAAQQSVEISRQGQIAVAETIEGMNVIRSRVESIAENILMLSERTTQIGDIIATVNAIADQSKMLALNASIEAARAGEEGRGFAVVAMEVRNLAEQSREATAQVRDILSEIQQATNTAVMVTEEGTKGVDLGVQLVDRAGRAIRELAGKLEDASQSAMQIAASTRQQSQGMDQLTSAMSSIKAATSSTATSMQQTQRNSKDLNEMARQMESAISAYRL